MEKPALIIGSSDFITKTITEYDIYAFAGVTGDFNSVHINEEKARNRSLDIG